MAVLYPSPLPEAVRSDPGRAAERRLYEAFARHLDGSHRVFHGVSWLAKRDGLRPRDGEADFVVAHERGGVFVLEVKGGAIGYDAASRSWTSTDRRGVVHSIKDPVEQAKTGKYDLRDKLRSLPDCRGEAPYVAHAVAFPDCAEEDADLRPDLPREIVIFSDDLDWIDRRVEAIFRYWQGRSHRKSAGSAEGVRLVERLLARSFELRSPLAAALREEEAEILRLSERQFQLLDFLDQQRRVAIRGGAGTGKTLLAAEKARRLAGEGFRTLLTCFNRPLADHLARVLGPVERLTVNTFHGLCEEMAKKAEVELDAALLESDPARYFERLPRALEDALDRMPDERFDAIVVDEAQDVGEDWWTDLELCEAEPGEGILFVFHDDRQNIYGKETYLPPGLQRFTLRGNLRNTRAIHRVAMRFYDGELQPEGPEGRPVEWIEAPDDAAVERELSRVLHRLVKEESVRPADIAVLSGRSMRRSLVGGREAIGAFPIATEWTENPHAIRAESIHRFKGLERPVVVLVELEAILHNEHLDEPRKRELLYVGLTRARVHLAVIAPRPVLDSLGADPPRR